METKLRTREEVEAQIRAKNPHADKDIIDALTTLSLKPEEQLADLRAKYPNISEEALLKYAKDDDTIAHSVLDTDIELGMWESMLDDEEEGELDDEEESEAEKAASQITNKFHSLIRKSIWGE